MLFIFITDVYRPKIELLEVPPKLAVQRTKLRKGVNFKKGDNNVLYLTDDITKTLMFFDAELVKINFNFG